MRNNLLAPLHSVTWCASLAALGMASTLWGQDSCRQRMEEIEDFQYAQKMGTLDARKRLAVTKAEKDAVALAISDENTRHKKARIDIDVQCFVPSVAPDSPC